MTVQALVQTLHHLNELHRKLLVLADAKKAIVIGNDIGELNRLVQQESQLLRKIAEQDQQRVEVIGSILLKRSYRPNASITVSELAKLIFNIEEKQALLDAQQTLLDTVGELQRRNALNQQLIEQSLAFLNYSVDVVMGPPQEDVVYTNPQHADTAQQRSRLFDTRG